MVCKKIVLRSKGAENNLISSVPNRRTHRQKIFQHNIKMRSHARLDKISSYLFRSNNVTASKKNTSQTRRTNSCRLFKRLYTNWELPTSDIKIALKFTLGGYPKLVYTVRVNGSNKINGIPTISKETFFGWKVDGHWTWILLTILMRFL